MKSGKILFGDDLQKTIEALKATNKVVNNIEVVRKIVTGVLDFANVNI